MTAVTWYEGENGDEVVDGVRVLKLCRHGAGVRGLRFFYPRWTSLCAALRRADADIYYHNNANCHTGQIAEWCVRHRRRFVYSVASDPACDSSMPLLRRRRERALYRFGLMNAHLLIAQTRKQQRMLREGFGRHAEIAPMPCPEAADTRRSFPRQPPSSGNPASVMWAGRVVELKRIEWFLQIARALPSVTFEIAASLNANEETAYSSAVLSQAASLPNVQVHRQVPRPAP